MATTAGSKTDSPVTPDDSAAASSVATKTDSIVKPGSPVLTVSVEKTATAGGGNVAPGKEAKSKKSDGLKRWMTLKRAKSTADSAASDAAPAGTSVETVGSPGSKQKSGFLKSFKGRSKTITAADAASSVDATAAEASARTAPDSAGQSERPALVAKTSSKTDVDKKANKKDKKKNIVKRSVTMMASKKSKIKSEGVTPIGDINQLQTSRVFQKQQAEGMEADKAAEILSKNTVGKVKAGQTRSATGTDILKSAMGPITSDNLKKTALNKRASLPAKSQRSTAASQPPPEFADVRLRSPMQRVDSQSKLPVPQVKDENELTRNKLFKSQVLDDSSETDPTSKTSAAPAVGVTDSLPPPPSDIADGAPEETNAAGGKQLQSKPQATAAEDPSSGDSLHAAISIGADDLLGQVLDSCQAASSPQVRLKQLHEDKKAMAQAEASSTTGSATMEEVISDLPPAPSTSPAANSQSMPLAPSPSPATDCPSLMTGPSSAASDGSSLTEASCGKAPVGRSSSSQSAGVLSVDSCHSVTADDGTPKKKKKSGATVSRSLSKLLRSKDSNKSIAQQGGVASCESAASLQSRPRSTAGSVDHDSHDGSTEGGVRKAVSSESQQSRTISSKVRGLFGKKRTSSSSSTADVAVEAKPNTTADTSETTSSVADHRGSSQANAPTEKVTVPVLETIPPSPRNEMHLGGDDNCDLSQPVVTDIVGDKLTGPDASDLVSIRSFPAPPSDVPSPDTLSMRDRQPSISSAVGRELAATSLPTPPNSDGLSSNDANAITKAAPAAESGSDPLPSPPTASDKSSVSLPLEADSEPLSPPYSVPLPPPVSDSDPLPPPDLDSDPLPPPDSDSDPLPPPDSDSDPLPPPNLDPLPPPADVDSEPLPPPAVAAENEVPQDVNHPDPPAPNQADLPPPEHPALTETDVLLTEALPQPPSNLASPTPSLKLAGKEFSDVPPPASVTGDAANLATDDLPQPPSNLASPMQKRAAPEETTNLPAPVPPVAVESSPAPVSDESLPPPTTTEVTSSPVKSAEPQKLPVLLASNETEIVNLNPQSLPPSVRPTPAGSPVQRAPDVVANDPVQRTPDMVTNDPVQQAPDVVANGPEPVTQFTRPEDASPGGYVFPPPPMDLDI